MCMLGLGCEKEEERVVGWGRFTREREERVSEVSCINEGVGG